MQLKKELKSGDIVRISFEEEMGFYGMVIKSVKGYKGYETYKVTTQKGTYNYSYSFLELVNIE